jgi:hypothetical protein
MASGITALQTDNSSPVDTAAARDRINEEVLSWLARDHARNQAEGYFQSHPYSQMFTAQSLATDEASLSANYMRQIFGGMGDPSQYETHRAYEHAAKQLSEAATHRSNTLRELNPAAFVGAGPSTKDSVLRTFAEQRQFYKGRVDSDAERALKQRATHDIVHTTYYGRPGSRGGRFHGIVGYIDKPEFRPVVGADFRPYAYLSSRTHAPREDGGTVPLSIQAEMGDDPRLVPIDDATPKTVPDASPVLHDLGAYAGNEVDRLAVYEDPEARFAALFSDRANRRWA